MVSANLKFTSPSDVADFVNIVSKFDTDIDIKYGSMVLDGKSIQGLYAIQLNTDLKCSLHCSLDEAKSIINYIQRFATSTFKED